MAMTYLLDLYRTLCGYAGVDVPEGVDGYDLRPVFEETEKTVRESVFLAYQNTMRTVRDRHLKLHVYPDINYRLLFDLEADPLEMTNLAERPERAKDVDRLLDEMKRWQKQLGDTAPLSVQNPKSKEINLTGTPRVLDRWQPEWIRDKYFGDRDAQKPEGAPDTKRDTKKEL
jgi:arylsulfatase A-like enzyme